MSESAKPTTQHRMFWADCLTGKINSDDHGPVKTTPMHQAVRRVVAEAIVRDDYAVGVFGSRGDKVQVIANIASIRSHLEALGVPHKVRTTPASIVFPWGSTVRVFGASEEPYENHEERHARGLRFDLVVWNKEHAGAWAKFIGAMRASIDVDVVEVEDRSAAQEMTEAVSSGAMSAEHAPEEADEDMWRDEGVRRTVRAYLRRTAINAELHAALILFGADRGETDGVAYDVADVLGVELAMAGEYRAQIMKFLAVGRYLGCPMRARTRDMALMSQDDRAVEVFHAYADLKTFIVRVVLDGRVPDQDYMRVPLVDFLEAEVARSAAMAN